ncbi:FAS1 domain [Dillenia turbinata]|uniref:FAS1 domain n=1 Tax=Dillenia turbinata TaxID=194707 RepID=A0AAN8ZCE6_9MAGN
MEFHKKMRRGRIFKDSIAFVCLIVAISCLLVVLMSIFRLPEVSEGKNALGFRSRGIMKAKRVSEDVGLGKLGEMIVEMLPTDLAFTVFVPSVRAFDRDLGLVAGKSLAAENFNDTYAILTRIMAFSTVPRMITSAAVPSKREVSFDSISGFTLYISKDSNGMLVVNGVRSNYVDIKRGELVIHVMNGVIMDAEFELSVGPDNDDED